MNDHFKTLADRYKTTLENATLSKSDKMRKLLTAGLKVGEIAKLTNGSVGHVQQVRNKMGAAPAPTPALAPTPARRTQRPATRPGRLSDDEQHARAMNSLRIPPAPEPEPAPVRRPAPAPRAARATDAERLSRAMGRGPRPAKRFKIEWTRRGKDKEKIGTIEELLEYFGYDLEVGRSYQRERGARKVKANADIKTGFQLVTALNNASDNAAANGSGSISYFNGSEYAEAGDGPKRYSIKADLGGRNYGNKEGTLEELLAYFSVQLEAGRRRQNEPQNWQIPDDVDINTGAELVSALNKASENISASGQNITFSENG